MHPPVNRIPLNGRVNDLNESRIDREETTILEAMFLSGRGVSTIIIIIILVITIDRSIVSIGIILLTIKRLLLLLLDFNKVQ